MENSQAVQEFAKNLQDLVLDAYQKELSEYSAEDLRKDPGCYSDAKFDAAENVSEQLVQNIFKESSTCRFLQLGGADMESTLKPGLQGLVEVMIEEYEVQKRAKSLLRPETGRDHER